MTEMVALGIVDSMRELINGISYEGPLFNDSAAINHKLIDAHLSGKEIAGRLLGK